MTWEGDEGSDAGLAVGEVAAEHEEFIAVQAMLMAPNDLGLQSLMIQEARIAVWQVDPTRLRSDDVRYVKRAIRIAVRAAFWREFRESGGAKREGIRAIERAEEEPLPTCLRPDLFGRHIGKAAGWLERRPLRRRKREPEVLTLAQILYRMERDKRRRQHAA